MSNTPSQAGSPAGFPWPLVAVPLALVALLAVGVIYAERSGVALALAVAAAILIGVMVHVGTMALVGGLFGWSAERIAFGTGAPWLRTSVAGIPVTFGVAFMAGAVQFGEEPPPFGWRRALAEISGCVVLLVLAAVLTRNAGVVAAVPGIWKSIFVGALSPLADAQALIGASAARLVAADGAALLGLVCLVLGAINLLPIPGLNGGGVILTLLPRSADGLAMLLAKCGVLLLLAVAVSWTVALATFVTRTLA